MAADVNELYGILCAHAARYPLMQPADAVKLIYQCEFGSGHMIKSEAAALCRLREEYESTAHDKTAPLYEYIGCGITRVNLAAVDADVFPLERLNAAFVAAANGAEGSMGGFKQKLNTLKRVCAEGRFTFGADELNEYLREYEKAGFPPVSHSERYREAYKPSYRIIRREPRG